ncbi:Arginase/deacetylase [Daldinia loculata]|nr:Arginase/deacetylase [Daldinia loculata]
MAFPERGRAQPKLEETANPFDDRELLRSLNKLSLSTSSANSTTRPSALRISSSPTSNAQSNHTDSRLTSISPSARAPSRSPVNRVNSNGLTSLSRSSTPTLLRKTSMNSLHSSNGIAPSRAPSRRGSSNRLSPNGPRSPLNIAEFREKPALTASSVAGSYMKKELELLHSESASYHPETIVILNDACYGHRYSRPRATKGDLNSIVERPERIQASVLGVSMAYVRLGERHCDGRYPIYPELDPTSIPTVPFHIRKTTRTLALDSAAVTNVHGTKWMEELKIMCESAETKLALNTNELRRPEMNRGSHASPPQELHKGDLYLCSESLNAFEGALGAVCDAVDGVFNDSPYKRAFVAVRPPGHHCSASHPSGFCWVNNAHVGIMHGFLNHGLTHAAIIDFDLHHGDGSQAIAWDHNKRSFTATKNMSAWKRTSIGYFSLHDINSYPCEYGDDEKVRNASVCVENAHGQSIWNVHLQEWKSDVEFWKLYQSKYSVLLDKARSYLRTQTERYRASGQVPKAVIFLSAGFDASEWEGAGMQRHKVNVPTEFYARLTRDVVKLASEEGLSVDGRVISVLEGGYSDRALYSGVFSHLSGLAGDDSTPVKEEIPNGLGHEMGNRVGSLSRRNTLTGQGIAGFPYDPNWWSGSELDQFDAFVNAPPIEQPKKLRAFVPGNYSSPTQASSAKAIDPTKVRRSVSGFSQLSVSRPPTPPLPDVPWTAAAHELSKLLIPKDRQVSSFKFEELNAGATKAKHERQSLPQSGSTSNDAAPTVAPTAAPVRKSQRERKPVKYAESEDPKPRRRTVGGSSILATEKALARGIPTQNGSGQTRNLGAVVAINDAPGALPRPSTSQTIRPESSISVRTQASTALNVRKTRPAVPIKKESIRAPRKTKAPVVKTEDASHPARKELPVDSSGDSTAIVKDSTTDIEKITGGMKKIKINVLTKEKKEARQKAEAEEKARRDNQASQESKPIENPKFSDSAIGIYPSLPVVGGGEHTTIQPSQPNAVHGDERVSKLGTGLPNILLPQSEIERFSPVNVPTILTPAEPDQSEFPPSPPEQLTPEASESKATFMQCQHNGQLPATVPFSSPIRMPEHIGSSPARQNGTRIPTFSASSVPSSPAQNGGHGFTSTSSIPFAPRSIQESWSKPRNHVPIRARPQSKGEAKDGGGSIWEIPETPQCY